MYGTELRLSNGVSLGARFHGEVSTRAQTYSGTGKVGDVWKSANFVGVDDVCCWHIASFRCCAAIWSHLE